MAMMMKNDCGKLTDSSCCNPPLKFDNCQKFEESWNKIRSKVPEGTLGNPVPKITPPYSWTPIKLPEIPYYPKTMSLARPLWEGWRSGANFMITDGVERPYGYPDSQYYRQGYCGPCCPCVPGTMPGGDPSGKNTNMRYIQLDYKNLLGSGFAMQGPPQSQTSPFMLNPGARTGCGQNHCPECSGVYKKKDQPVKFQVCIGDHKDRKTVQPCPVQPLKIYVPLSMLPRGGPDGDKADDDCDNNDPQEQKDEQKAPPQDTSCLIPGTTCGAQLTSMDPQQFEVSVPGEACAYNGGRMKCEWPPAPETKIRSNNNSCSTKERIQIEPCGCCRACKDPPKFCTPTSGRDPKKCQFADTVRPDTSFGNRPELCCNKKNLKGKKCK